MAPLGGAGGAALSSSPTSRAGVSVRSPPPTVLAPPRNTTASGAPSSGAETEDDFDEADGEDDDDEEIIEAGAGEQLRNETSIKNGYLWKRGEKRKNWKKRWFVLRSSKLCYYKNDKEYQLLRFIDINDVHTVASIELKRIQHSFGIVTSSRQYYVRASSQADKDAWITSLNEVKEALRQRSTLTQEIAVDDLLGARRSSVVPGQRLSPVLLPAQGTSAVTSVVIPGQGQYSAPAQPRAIPGTMAFSPLTSTSASASGSVSEGEQPPPAVAPGFGLSYASQSSAAQSLSSSPGAHRATLHAARSPSPQSHSGGELSQGEGASRRQRSVARRTVGTAGAGRDASAGSSGGEGKGTSTGWTLNSPLGSGAIGDSSTAYASGAGALSSSDEEDGEDWDEDEVADQAMPLPGANIPHLSTSSAAVASATAASAQPAVQTPQRANSASTTAEFLKDPNNVINQGYLMKQSSRRKTWRKRWFVLTSSKLMYTRSHMDAKPHRQIPLSSILDALEYTSKKATITLPSLSSAAPAGPQSPMLHSPSAVSGGFSFGNNETVGTTTAAATAAERRETSAGSVAQAGGSSGFSSASEREATPASVPATPQSTATLVADPNSSTSTAAAAAERQLSPSAAPSGSGALSLPSIGTLNLTSPGSSVLSPNAPVTPGGGGGLGTSVTGLGQAKRKKENCFKIITPKRTYVVCAPTEEEEIKWLSALQALLTRTRGAKGVPPNGTASGGTTTTQGGPTPNSTVPAVQTQEQPKLARAPSTSTNASGEATPTAVSAANTSNVAPAVDGSSKLTQTTSTPQPHAAAKPRQRVQSNASNQSAS